MDDSSDCFNPDERAWIRAALRRASHRWKGRTEAKQKARIRRGLYKCAHCGSHTAAREIELDHVACVVPPQTKAEDQSFDEFIARLFVPASGFQVLCRSCHYVKTARENKQRNRGFPKENAKTAPRKK